MHPLLWVLPWALLLLGFLARVRLPRELPPDPHGTTGRETPTPPSVSVIIPARNEAHNIERVLASVAASRYPSFEVIVVDDQSGDGTGALARGVPPGNASRVRVADGLPLPDGWLGKPWSCAQGARLATGDLLLFTDADTVHAPDLLARAVAGLLEDRADALTLVGRQLMGTFWERLIQPSVFLMMLTRFRDARQPLPPARWREAIANGQYLMFRRTAYDALGGHEAVRGEVVEDLRLAQILVRQGARLSLRSAEGALATRMYRNLGELVRGWSKNLALGAQLTVPRPLRPLVVPASLLLIAAIWLLPPVALVGALAGALGPGVLHWSASVVALNVLFWGAFMHRMGAPFSYGLLHPLGVGVTGWILLRSWLRGRRIEWKDRHYRVEPIS